MQHPADALNAAIAADLRETFTAATVSTALLDTIRAMDGDARRRWIAQAADVSLDRLAECFAAEHGALSTPAIVAEYRATLDRLQREARADLAAAGEPLPLVLPPYALIQAAGDELLGKETKGSRRYNAAKRAALLTGQVVVFGAGVLMPSASGEGPYFLHQEEGHWICDCRAGVEHGICKHALRMELIDRAWELLSAQDAEQPEPEEEEEEEVKRCDVAPFAGRAFGARLARARLALVAY
jgi:hypothetical protein